MKNREFNRVNILGPGIFEQIKSYQYQYNMTMYDLQTILFKLADGNSSFEGTGRTS